ncbi:MAG: sorbosone dehydrogenase [Gemmatimonadetes bacterium]|nr:sorbosone dehydrogenase [Gemmatimonadota bacterium]NIO32506.1 sorbosone dehydrogenase [Gemmatimonadota bacterium]
MPRRKRADTSLATVLAVLALTGLPGAPQGEEGCDPTISLPDGFCARIFADSIGRARHIVVAENGDVFVALRRSRGGAAVGVVALRDSDGDAKADIRHHFGDFGGTGIALYDGYLYFGANDRVMRYPLPAGSLDPSGALQTIVSGLPDDRSHRDKSIAVTAAGGLYVNIGAPSNACQEESRTPGSPGIDPCPDLERRAGIWRFDADRQGQNQDDGERFATGLRNVVALTLHPQTGDVYGAQHGRDQLGSIWPDLFTVEDNAEKPSEELVKIERGDDFGWPYCYHDPVLNRLVLAPEYGGDGNAAGRCSSKKEPLVAFPAHWGPNALLFYTGDQFPERYRGGAFIAFHGSWNRAPLPQGGYNVVFVPFAGDEPAGDWEVFADGFAGEEVSPRGATHRPSGLAQGPDGSLYVTDDRGGRIWKIVYTGDD